MDRKDAEGLFEIQIQQDSSRWPTTITVLGPVPGTVSRVSSIMTHTRPSTQSTSATIPVNANKSRVFSCHSEEFSRLLDDSPMLVTVTLNAKDKHGIVTKIDKHHYILNYTSSSPTPSNDLSLPFKTPQPDTWILPSERFLNAPKNELQLSMAPPINSSPIQKSDNEDTIIDPFDYLLDKYFENLYMLTTPLAFFTKSVFSRLTALCANDIKFYESILSQFIIQIDNFDARHLTSNNGILNSSAMFEKEEIYRKGFVAKTLNLIDFDVHSTDFQETNRSLATILNNFKVREIHLQMLILLELIHITGRDDTKLFKRKQKKAKKTSLIGRKRLASAITGGAAPASDTPDENKEELTYNQLFDTYLDKLTINDLLNDQSKSEYFTPKFINYIVMPFFDKKCPNTVSYMIKKVKGPSFKANTSTNHAKKKSQSVSEESSSELVTKEPSIQRVPSTMKLGDIAELKTSLTRSNSDLQSLKRTSSFNSSNLSKRQVDMSIPIITSEPRAKRASSQIFNRVGKKLASSSLIMTTSVSQVDATPMKKSRTVDIMQTPADANKPKQEQLINSVDSDVKVNSVKSSSPVIERTPMQASLQSPIAIRSTVRRPGEPIDLSERLMGSPVARNVKRRLFAPPPVPKK